MYKEVIRLLMTYGHTREEAEELTDMITSIVERPLLDKIMHLNEVISDVQSF